MRTFGRDVSFDYWNDEEIEAEKTIFAKYFKDPSVESLKPSHREAYEDCIAFIEAGNLDTQNILSIGCGSCWLEELLAKKYKVGEFTGIDFSSHRISQYAEKAMLRSGAKSVNFIKDDIFSYEATGQFDIILMCQAFHHFDSPIHLLRKLRPLLKSSGAILIVGEHQFTFPKIIRNALSHFVKFSLNYNGYRHRSFILPGYSNLFPPDPIKGDHHYHFSDYLMFFNRGGYKLVQRNEVTGRKTKAYFIQLEA